MTKAQAKKIAYGWCADLLGATLSSGGLEGQGLSEEDECKMEEAVREIAAGLQRRGVPRG